MNKVILLGRLTANPELKQTNSGISFTRFRLAVNRSYVRQGEERKADFIDIVCWRNTAEFVDRYFVKGQQVAVCGSLQVRDWQDQQGNTRRSYEVVADEVFFADSKRDSAGSGSGAPIGDFPGSNMPAPDFISAGADFEELTEDDGLPF